MSLKREAHEKHKYLLKFKSVNQSACKFYILEYFLQVTLERENFNNPNNLTFQTFIHISNNIVNIKHFV